jgi:hypothetical protein
VCMCACVCVYVCVCVCVCVCVYRSKPAASRLIIKAPKINCVDDCYD